MTPIHTSRFPGLLLPLASLGVLMLFGVSGLDARPRQLQTQETTASGQRENELVIETDSELPDSYPQADYEFRFRARGGVPAWHWRVEKGALPPGITLEADGLLHGKAERVGNFEFLVSVRDGSQPQQTVQKGFLLRVKSALSLKWKNPAHVTGSRIEGSVEVSNTTPDDIDLTFIVMAVQGNGRATAIGYQHLLLRRGTPQLELPFGETLPRGGYVVHVDAVGEVPAKSLIYRDRLQTPGALQVTLGP
ncbi:MAG TPA: hypothetical protein VF123_18655 [Candidatus Sulfotelmatobacter sp.]